MARILVLSFSDLARDPRVDRHLRALAPDHELVSAGFGAPGLEVARHVDLSAARDRSLTLAQKARGAMQIGLQHYERAYRGNRMIAATAQQLADVRPDLVIANDVNALPVALEVAHDAPVLYDAHEYWPEQGAQKRWWRLLMAPYFRHLSERYIPRAAAMTTVSEPIAERYGADTGVRPVVVLNAPPYHDIEPAPVGDPIRMVHFGAADRARRLETMIDVMAGLDQRWTLDFLLLDRGDGYVQQLERRAAGDARISFLEPVPMRELVTTANRYDVGLYILDDRSFNRRNALPNKLFEFIQARLAVAIGPSPAMAEVVRRFDCGMVAPDFSAAAMAQTLSATSTEQIAGYKAAAHAAARELSAERSQTVLTELVDRLLARS